MTTQTPREELMSDTQIAVPDEEMLKRHLAAEATVKSFHYEKKNGGENNLHYHTNAASFWIVLKGRVRFYGPNDVLIGEFGPHEGTITPRYARYWFENVGEEDLEILQVSAFSEGAKNSGRTDAAPQKFDIKTAEHYSRVTSEQA